MFIGCKIKKFGSTDSDVWLSALPTGAGDRGRTGTSITAHGILSPGRLPVPPHRQIIIIYAQERLYHIFFDLSNFLLKFFIKRFKLIDLN